LPLPLVERSEDEVAQIIRKKVEGIKEVKGYHQLTVRMTGKRFYVDMHALLDSNLSFENAHRIASNIESEVRRAVPNARVTIHTEPVGGSQQDMWKLVKEVAEGVPGSRGVHNIHIQEIDGKLCVDLHVEVSANMTVKQAHQVSGQVERQIRTANPDVSEVIVHMESASERISKELTGVETELESYIEHVAKHFPKIRKVHGIEVRKIGEALHVVLRCHFDPDTTMAEAHEMSNSLEREIKAAYPRIARMDVHEEPA